MKHKYYIFAGSHEDGKRGWNDFLCESVGAEAAMIAVSDAMLDEEMDWLHIVDVETKSIVYRAVRFVQGSWIIVPHSTKEDLEV